MENFKINAVCAAEVAAIVAAAVAVLFCLVVCFAVTVHDSQVFEFAAVGLLIFLALTFVALAIFDNLDY